MQVHSATVEKAQAGQRVAMNLAGIERDAIRRGDVIATPGTLTVTDRFDARFTYLGSPGDDKPFVSGARVHVNHGTREVLGRVLLMDAERLAPGESALAQVRLEEPLAPRYDDRFIVRSYSPVYTIGGGVVLDAMPPRRTRLGEHERALLEALLAHDLSTASVGLLASRALPMTSAEVAAALGVPRGQVADELNRAKLERLKVGGETAFVTPEALDALVAAIERELLAFHAENPKATGDRDLRAARHRRQAPRTQGLRRRARGRRRARSRHRRRRGRRDTPRPPSRRMAAEQSAAEALLPLLERQGLSPETVSELAAETGTDVGIARKVLGRLASEGRIVRISSELHFSAAAMAGARESLTAHLRRIPRARPRASCACALGVSRKYAIPLLEYFDAQGLTRREGDVRRAPRPLARRRHDPRQLDGEARAVRLDVLGADLAVVKVDEPAGDREAEPGAAGVLGTRAAGAEEAVEDAVEVVGRDARPVVGHAQEDAVAHRRACQRRGGRPG